MPCRTFDFGNGVTGFACSRGRREHCQIDGCTAPTVALCDFELGGSRRGKTCSRRMCARHRRTQGAAPGVTPGSGLRQSPTIDYCPSHDDLARNGSLFGGTSCPAQVSSTAGDPPSPAGRPGDASADTSAQARTPGLLGRTTARDGGERPATRLTFPIPDASQVTSCRSCDALVVWIVTKNGKRLPVDASAPTRGQSHFSTCPQSGEWRRSR